MYKRGGLTPLWHKPAFLEAACHPMRSVYNATFTAAPFVFTM